jgi:hypothetical protein
MDTTFELYAQKLPLGSQIRYTREYRRRYERFNSRTQRYECSLTSEPIGIITHLEPRDGMVPVAYICALDSVSDKPVCGILADNVEVVA